MQYPVSRLGIVWITLVAIILPTIVSQTFKAAGKQYESQAIYREMVKAQTGERIKVTNEQYGLYFKSGHNKFSAYTVEQWQKLFLGGRKSDPNSPEVQFVQGVTQQQKDKLGIESKAALLNAVVPAVFNIDYTKTNPPLVTSVKDQGSCGSCWAFAAIGQIESYFIKKHKLYLDLSEQQMVQCVPVLVSSNKGCGGGSLTSVGYYAAFNPIAQEKHYLYTATQSGCSQAKIDAGRTFRIGTYSFTQNCVTTINALLAYKPIAVCAGVDANWMSYISGVLPVCNENVNGGHCFILVGAVSDGTSNILTNYYKFKNSWGTSWGENGYIRIYRDAQDTTVGPCALCQWGSMYTL